MHTSKLVFAALAVGGFFALPTAANAQLAIDRLWVDMDSSGVARSDFVVRNESKDKYYVTITTTEVVAPGTAEEKRVSIANPEELGLLVTPNRVILEPGQLRAFRIVSLNKNIASDRVYRVNVTPQIGSVSVQNANAENRGLAIKVLAAFDVLVTVRPKDNQPTLSVQRDGEFLTLSNPGNSNLLLLDGAVCPVAGTALSAATQAFFNEQDKLARERAGVTKTATGEVVKDAVPSREFKPDACVGLPGRRLYPGNVWKIPASVGEALRFSRRDSASKDLEPITIRCDTAGKEGSKDSEYCKDTHLGAEPGRQI